MAYEFGVFKIYKLTVHKPHPDYPGDSAILFKQGILMDGQSVMFRISAMKTTTTTHDTGEVETSEVEYETRPDTIGGTLLYDPTFKLIGEYRNQVEVDCSSVSCREKHTVNCTIAPITDEELEAMRAQWKAAEEEE